MKFSATLCSLTGLLGLALAAAPIKNDGISADIVVPDKYIVTYKTGTDATERKNHENGITKKAKKKNKKGVVDTIDVGGLHAYVVEIPPSEVKDIANSNLVSNLQPFSRLDRH